MKPQPFGVEDITRSDRETWEAEYGEFWADAVMPEVRTQVWDFATEQEAREFLTGPVPSHYFARIFERVNMRLVEPGLWEWDEREIEQNS